MRSSAGRDTRGISAKTAHANGKQQRVNVGVKNWRKNERLRETITTITHLQKDR
jgi:uncharacterized hydantoinase/oxoprolinase family protein